MTPVPGVLAPSNQRIDPRMTVFISRANPDPCVETLQGTMLRRALRSCADSPGSSAVIMSAVGMGVGRMKMQPFHDVASNYWGLISL